MPIQAGALGNLIRKKRMESQLTQEQLAEILGITATHMKHLESEHRMPSVEVLFRLTETLHLSLDDLLNPESSKHSDSYNDAKHLLDVCTERELEIVCDVLHSLLNHRESL